MAIFRKQTEEKSTLEFIDEVQKRISRCRTKQEKDLVINIILDRLGHKHKVTGAFKVMEKMKEHSIEEMDKTKRMRRQLELE